MACAIWDSAMLPSARSHNSLHPLIGLSDNFCVIGSLLSTLKALVYKQGVVYSRQPRLSQKNFHFWNKKWPLRNLTQIFLHSFFSMSTALSSSFLSLPLNVSHSLPSLHFHHCFCFPMWHSLKCNLFQSLFISLFLLWFLFSISSYFIFCLLTRILLHRCVLCFILTLHFVLYVLFLSSLLSICLSFFSSPLFKAEGSRSNM